MNARAGQYPPEVEKVLGHARRLAKVLDAIERSTASSWCVGLTSELKTVVSCALADFRDGLLDGPRTSESIASHVDGVHRTVAKHQRLRHPTLECCGPDDAITAVDANGSASNLLSALSIITAGGPEASTTIPDAWEDSPEMLERFYRELARVDRHARMFARRVAPSGVTLDDLRAFGREGLLDAARSFKEEQAVPFSAWADLRIKNAMIDGVRKWGTLPRGMDSEWQALEASPVLLPDEFADDPAHASLAHGGLASDVMPGVVEGIDRFTPETAVSHEEDRRLVHALLTSLPARERGLVEAYFLEERSLEQASTSVGMSISAGSRALKRALEAMARMARLREQGQGSPHDFGGARAQEL